jgi:membrane-associated phospholipid phosphatase
MEIFGYNLPENLRRLGEAAPIPEVIKSGVFFNLMKWIYQVFESPGAAMPSSHVAIALCTVSFSFRYLHGIRWPHLVTAILLCVSTVYCRYHYAADVAAGIVTALVLVPIGNRLYFLGQATTNAVR